MASLLSSSVGNAVGSAVGSAMGILKRAPRYDIEDYHVREVAALAEGGFAFVSIVEECERGVPGAARLRPQHQPPRKGRYALKKMIIQSSEQREEVEKEVSALRQVHHANIVRLLAFAEHRLEPHKSEALLLMPLYDSALNDDIERVYGTDEPPFREELLLDIGLQAALGLHALHMAGLRHNDIKPHNVLIRGGGGGDGSGVEAVLTDLGSTSPARQEVKARAEALEVQEWAQSHTTAPYRAPELYDTPSECVISEKTDCWSFGCLLFAMAFAHGPFENATEGVLTLNILNGHFSFPVGRGFSRDLCEIVQRLLTRDPDDRAGMIETIDWIEKARKGQDPFQGVYTVPDPVEEALKAEQKEREAAEREAALQAKLNAQLSNLPGFGSPPPDKSSIQPGKRFGLSALTKFKPKGLRKAKGGKQEETAQAAAPSEDVESPPAATSFANFADFGSPANDSNVFGFEEGKTGSPEQQGAEAWADFNEAPPEGHHANSLEQQDNEEWSDFNGVGENGEKGDEAVPQGGGEDGTEEGKASNLEKQATEEWGDFNEVDEAGNQQELR